jgi:two-component system response regulator FlrC
LTLARVLVVDDEAGLRTFLSETLEQEGHEVTVAGDGLEAEKRLAERNFELVVTDLKMPGKDGMSLLRKLRSEQPETEVVVLTAHGTVDTAVEAMKLGAFDYLQKPLRDPDELALVAQRALERRGLLQLKATAEIVSGDAPRLTYGDAAMTPVVNALEKVARTSATVLLLGESGTGKEVAARAVHRMSERRERPFMAINCAALSETLLESELFGHERGAFTGANERRRGRLEVADGGTFFLDEVGELKPELQAKLLRVIQERRFERVGGTRTIETDVRWIAATNRDLRQAIQEGRFREDLYHRLAVFPIRMPALRERMSDLVPLARALLTRIAADLGRRGLELGSDAEKKLATWKWPGNVRELANTLERAAILAEGSQLKAEHIWLDASPSELSGGPAPAPTNGGATVWTHPQSLAELEQEAILRTLATVDGNRRKAAEILGIGERTLYDKLKRYGLDA